MGDGIYLPFLDREFILAFSAKSTEGETNPASQFRILLEELHKLNISGGGAHQVWDRIDIERSALKLKKGFEVVKTCVPFLPSSA